MKEMKLLLILCSGEQAGPVRKVLEAHGVEGFTELPDARGAGTTGLHLGTRAFPGTATVIFSALGTARALEVVAALKALAASCSPGEGVKVFLLDAAEAV